ncbi:MAG TPA: peptidoglycan bridge formation glycyltransferase FemA/FemB family protein [Patescibacteria group bacterium]|nr:peptidoglycan bridge formation glycyltransferase FemA/FemB family protein [Patescibacteria group bacterium]
MAEVDLGPVIDIRQSPGFAKYMASLGWQVDQIGGVVIYSKNIPIVGTLIKIQRPNLPLPLEEIDRLAQEKKAFLVKVEPNLLLDGFNPQIMGGFRKDSSPILPTRSIWIDLTLSPETLFANLDKDTRNLIRRAAKDGVAVIEGSNLKEFYLLWAGNAKKKGFYMSFEKELTALWKSVPEKRLLIAKYQGQIVAAALLVGFSKVLYYSFAGSTELGRSCHAPYLLMWEVIKRAKKWGYARLDLEGVADPQVKKTKSWSGFSRFKKGFGGKEVQYAGSFSKYYSPLGKIFGRFI